MNFKTAVRLTILIAAIVVGVALARQVLHGDIFYKAAVTFGAEATLPFEVVTDEVFCASIVEAGVIPESMFPTHEDYMIVFAAEAEVEADQPKKGKKAKAEDHDSHDH